MTEVLVERAPADIDPGEWQALVGARPQLRLELLQEYAGAFPGELRILLQLRAGRIAGAVVGTTSAGRPQRLLESLLFGRVAGIAVRLGLLGNYFCAGPPLGQDSGVLLAEEDVSGAALDSLLAGLEAWASARGLAVGFFAVPQADAALGACLQARGYLDSIARTATALDVHWHDFESYCRWLEANDHSGARHARYERRRSERGGVSVHTVESSADNGAQLYKLADAHYRRKNAAPLPIPSSMLQTLLPRLGDRLLLLEARRNARQSAMLGIVISGDAGWLAFIGVDDHERPNDFTYFNLVFYSLADHVARLGLRTLHMGNSAYEAKLRRGARRVPMRCWFRPRGPAHRLLLAPAFLLHARLLVRKLS